MLTEDTQLSGLLLRVATVMDRPQLIPLINSAFAVETFLDGTRTDEARLAAVMEKSVILVLEDSSGHLLASVCTELRGDRGYLGMLAVDPAHQRAGLGRRLMQAAESLFRRQGCPAVDITVLSLRPELPPIYRRLGYIETGSEPFVHCVPLRPGIQCHCIIMSKSLESGP